MSKGREIIIAGLTRLVLRRQSKPPFFTSPATAKICEKSWDRCFKDYCSRVGV